MNQNIQKEYHIFQDGSGDFRSLFEALSALQSSEFPEEANQAENLPAAPDFRSSGEIQSRLYFFFMPEFTGSELSF